mgnify:CR=1 FL=1
MSPIWDLQAPHADAAVPSRAVAALLDVALSPSSADALLRAVQAVVPVDYLSLVRIHSDRPELVEGSASRPQERAVVAQCFGIYRRHYYRRDAILPLAQLQAHKMGIRIVDAVDADCPPVLCDRTMVEQVLLNLARNGMQAMPQGDPAPRSGLRVLRIEVGQARLHSGHAPGGQPQKMWVSFAVTDHGLGLSPEVQAKLFTPFFTTRAEGMGLGLSLCRTVIEQHGGVLTHEPHQPRGTVFRFTLPVSMATSPPLSSRP